MNSTAVCKECNIKTHFDTSYKESYDKYIWKLLEGKLTELKMALQKHKEYLPHLLKRIQPL